jgi:hypothetical protein
MAPLTLFLSDFYDERFFQAPSTWQCINHPYFEPEFAKWMQNNIAGTKISYHEKKARSHNGWGNKGGWMTRPTKVELEFPNPGAEMLFRMKWDHFR